MRKIGRDAVENELGSLPEVGRERAQRLLDLVPDDAEDREGDLERLRRLGQALPPGRAKTPPRISSRCSMHSTEPWEKPLRSDSHRASPAA